MLTNQYSFGDKKPLKNGLPPRVNSRYFINHRHRVTYCPIEKNSCTYLKHHLMLNSEHGQKYIDSGLNVHTFYQRYGVMRVETVEELLDPRYLLFVVLREPLERIVSAYLNKFVRNLNPPMVVKAVQHYAELTGQDLDLKLGLTFRQFVELLTLEKRDNKLDPHWRPQSSLLYIPLSMFDYAVPMSRFEEFLDRLENWMEVELPREKTSNFTKYDSFDLGLGMFDMMPAELRKLEKRPDKSGLVTEEFAEALKTRYAKDFELYNTAVATFDEQLNR